MVGWTITRGPLGVCESCANAKARQNNVPKISTGAKVTVINGRWFHDSSTLKVHKGENVSSKICDLTVDELTGIPFTGIYNKKNEFVESMCQRIQPQTARGCPFLIMRQKNAGENKILEKRLQSADWKLPVKMEYTAANTPQQNALVEVKFTYLAATAVSRNRRLDFFPEVVMTMTKLDWLKLSQSIRLKRPGLSIMVYPYPFIPSIYVPWEKQESSNPVKTENWEPGNHWYVHGLRLKSQGRLLQNVESNYEEGFQDT
jgi:hypothetical protein